MLILSSPDLRFGKAFQSRKLNEKITEKMYILISRILVTDNMRFFLPACTSVCLSVTLRYIVIT